jgi:hypothetical protein
MANDHASAAEKHVRRRTCNKGKMSMLEREASTVERRHFKGAGVFRSVDAEVSTSR